LNRQKWPKAAQKPRSVNTWAQHMAGVGLAGTLLLVWFLAGCSVLGLAGPGSPLPPPLPRLEVEAILSEHSGQIRTLKDTDISLVLESGPPEDRQKSPTLGGIMALDLGLPALWLRAEKMGQKVFTLKVDGDSFWLELPDTREVVVGGGASFERLPHLVRPAEVAAFLGSPQQMGITLPATRMIVQEHYYRFDVRAGGRIVRRIWVGRQNVAISRIAEYDSDGRVRTEVCMDKYSEVEGIRLPLRFAVDRPRSGCKATIWFSRPKLNERLDRRLFQPGARPGWHHVDLDRQPLSDVKAFRPNE